MQNISQTSNIKENSRFLGEFRSSVRFIDVRSVEQDPIIKAAGEGRTAYIGKVGHPDSKAMGKTSCIVRIDSPAAHSSLPADIEQASAISREYGSKVVLRVPLPQYYPIAWSSPSSASRLIAAALMTEELLGVSLLVESALLGVQYLEFWEALVQRLPSEIVREKIFFCFNGLLRQGALLPPDVLNRAIALIAANGLRCWLNWAELSCSMGEALADRVSLKALHEAVQKGPSYQGQLRAQLAQMRICEEEVEALSEAMYAYIGVRNALIEIEIEPIESEAAVVQYMLQYDRIAAAMKKIVQTAGGRSEIAQSLIERALPFQDRLYRILSAKSPYFRKLYSP